MRIIVSTDVKVAPVLQKQQIRTARTQAGQNQ